MECSGDHLRASELLITYSAGKEVPLETLSFFVFSLHNYHLEDACNEQRWESKHGKANRRAERGDCREKTIAGYGSP